MVHPEKKNMFFLKTEGRKIHRPNVTPAVRSWFMMLCENVNVYIYIYILYMCIYIFIVTGRAPSDKTKTTFKWESQLLMDVLTLSTPDRPTAKQSLVLACTNVSCRGFELLLPTGLASPK